MNFASIRFGEHSAEIEVAEDPELFEHGYYDHAGWVNGALHNRMFLFLGTKGTGKSTIAQKILLGRSFDCFPQLTDLSEFPFSNFYTAAFQGGTGRERTIPDSWVWLILLSFLFSLEKDPGRLANDQFDALIAGLRKVGFGPPERFDDLLIQTRDRKSVFSGPSFDLESIFGVEASVTTFSYERQSSAKKDIAIHRLVSYAKSVLLNQQSGSKHILMFDGLDRALLGDATALQSIAALISTASALNQEFRRQCSPCKVLVFCRTELFEKLDVYNANSIRQTYALELAWYDNRRNVRTSHLVRLANLRAELSLGGNVDIFKEFFEEEVGISGKYRLTAIWILFHTRNTPRDFLRALTYIQRYTRDLGGKISAKELIAGLTDYSREYFVNEIRDELRGYISAENMQHTMQVLINMRSNKFETDQFLDAMKNLGANGDLSMEILRALFACSAIGNLFRAGDGEMRPVSKHYSHTARFDPAATIIVHRGLWKAFNYV
ncbi:MAG: hypothetical protein M3495_11225 [Pseudomonadota bacterium]|nr:hypothetical protein [Pseudomonadota bacterium]